MIYDLAVVVEVVVAVVFFCLYSIADSACVSCFSLHAQSSYLWSGARWPPSSLFTSVKLCAFSSSDDAYAQFPPVAKRANFCVELSQMKSCMVRIAYTLYCLHLFWLLPVV